MKITLPKKPIDGYEIVWYSIEYDTVTKHSAKYFINTPYEKVVIGGTGGVPFDNHWAIFDNGRLTGRSDDRWDRPYKWDFTSNYATAREAGEALLSKMKSQVTHLETVLSVARENLKRLEDVLS